MWKAKSNKQTGNKSNFIWSGSYQIYFVDKNNEKLFRISINMVDAADFIQDTLVKLQNEHRLKVM